MTVLPIVCEPNLFNPELGQCISDSSSSISLFHGSKPCRDQNLYIRILAFDPVTSLLLLSALPSPSSPVRPSSDPTSTGSTSTLSAQPRTTPTLLINVSTPLLGQSPALSDLSRLDSGVFSRTAQGFKAPHATDGDEVVTTVGHNSTGRDADGLSDAERYREALKIARGEIVMVVGWLEGDGRKIARKVSGLKRTRMVSTYMMCGGGELTREWQLQRCQSLAPWRHRFRDADSRSILVQRMIAHMKSFSKRSISNTRDCPLTEQSTEERCSSTSLDPNKRAKSQFRSVGTTRAAHPAPRRTTCSCLAPAHSRDTRSASN
jgi:hypothetical protein